MNKCNDCEGTQICQECFGEQTLNWETLEDCPICSGTGICSVCEGDVEPKSIIIGKLYEALMIDEELGSLFDDMTEERDGKLFIDGIVFEILQGYHGGGLYQKIDGIVTEWAKSQGGDYYDFETASIITAAS